LSVQLSCDWVHDTLDLSQLLLQILYAGARTVLIDPVRDILNSGQNGFLVFIGNLAGEAFLVAKLVLETIDKGRKLVESLNPLALGVVLSSELLSFGNHAIDIFLTEATLLIRDRN